jgi:mRNA interferase MazF
MRPIYIAQLDKLIPVVVLTRELVRNSMSNVTVAPINSTIGGLYSEVCVGQENNLDGPGVISCDNIQTIPRAALGQQIGWLLAKQGTELGAAINHAFDLEITSIDKG